MRFLLARFHLLFVAARRLWNYRLLMLCLLAGLIASVALLASIPLYADAVHNRLLQGELTETGTRRPPFAFLWRYVGAWNGDVSWADYLPIDEYLSEQSATIIDLPLTQQVRHVSTTKLRLYATDVANFNSGDPLLWAGVGFISGLEEHIQLIEGSFPAQSGESLPVIVSQATAEQLGLQVGEHYVLFTPGQDGTQIPVQVSGIWQATDPTDPFWFYQPAAFNETLLTSEAAFTAQVASRLEETVSTAVWYQVFDGRRIRPAGVGRLLDNIATVSARAHALLNNTALDTSPVTALTDYGQGRPPSHDHPHYLQSACHRPGALFYEPGGRYGRSARSERDCCPS